MIFFGSKRLWHFSLFSFFFSWKKDTKYIMTIIEEIKCLFSETSWQITRLLITKLGVYIYTLVVCTSLPSTLIMLSLTPRFPCVSCFPSSHSTSIMWLLKRYIFVTIVQMQYKMCTLYLGGIQKKSWKRDNDIIHTLLSLWYLKKCISL